MTNSLRLCGDLLTLQEAAFELQISTRTLRRMVVDGEIEIIKVYHSQRIRKQVLIDYINNQQEHNHAERHRT